MGCVCHSHKPNFVESDRSQSTCRRYNTGAPVQQKTMIFCQKDWMRDTTRVPAPRKKIYPLNITFDLSKGQHEHTKVLIPFMLAVIDQDRLILLQPCPYLPRTSVA